MRPRLLLAAAVTGLAWGPGALEAQVLDAQMPDIVLGPFGFAVREVSPYDSIPVEADPKQIPASSGGIRIKLAQNEYEHTSIVASTHWTWGSMDIELSIPGISDAHPKPSGSARSVT